MDSLDIAFSGTWSLLVLDFPGLTPGRWIFIDLLEKTMQQHKNKSLLSLVYEIAYNFHFPKRNCRQKIHRVDYFTTSFPYAFPFRKDDATTSARRIEAKGAVFRTAAARSARRGDDFALSNRRVVSLGQPPQPLRRRARRPIEQR